MDSDHPWRQMAIMSLAVGLAMWAEMPAWQRQHLAAAARARTRRVLGWLARRAGHRGMTHELAGRDEAAAAGYSLAEVLAKLRDRV